MPNPPEQEYFVYLNSGEQWWHGSCWDRVRRSRKGPMPTSAFSVDALSDALADDLPSDHPLFDPEDREDFSDLGEDDLVVVTPWDFLEYRGIDLDENEEEAFRCGTCRKIIRAPSM